MIDSKTSPKEALLENTGCGGIGSCVEPIAEATAQATAEITDQQDSPNIFGAVSEVIICYDTNLHVVWTNQHACRLFNLSNEQISSKKCYELFYSEDTPCPDCPVIKTLKTGKEEEVNLTTPDGKCWLFHTHPFRDSMGNISGVIGRVKNTAELAQRYKQHHREIVEIADFKKLLSLLTEREREVMQLVAEGYPNKVTGTKLGISPKTVEIHRARVMTKLRMNSTAQLVRYLTKDEILGT